jgi:hypothetical protein
VANEPVPTRKYNDREIALILKKAAERQEDVAPKEGGYSLAELEEIAAQAGIDATHVRSAARDLSMVDRPAGHGFVGSPTIIELERTVEGEVAESEYGDLVELIRDLTHEVGTVTRVDRTMEWVTRGQDMAGMHISINPGKGHTRIRLVTRHDGVAFVLFLVTGMLGTLLGIPVWMALLGHGFPAVLGVMCGTSSILLGDRAIMRAVSNRRQRSATQVIDALAEHVARVATRPNPLTPFPTGEGGTTRKLPGATG